MLRLTVCCSVVVFALGCQCGVPNANGDGGGGGDAMGGGDATGGGSSSTGGGTTMGGGAAGGTAGSAGGGTAGSAGGGAAGGGTAGSAGGGNTLMDGGVCTPAGQPCDGMSTCCSGGTCVNGLCRAQMFCSQVGVACTSPTECCSGRCTGNTCAAQQCSPTGATCTNGSDCCTGLCNGVCQALPGGSCGVVGDSCPDAGSACCSSLCRSGRCERAYSCQPNGDVCRSDSECCGTRCSANNDGGVGRCLFVTGMGGGSCLQEGNPCSGGSNCCSRTCFDPGTGASVCLPAGGCRLTGTWCANNDECCGGGVNPNGSVVCRSGRCDNGNACNGVGNICGRANLPDGGSIMINASMNCCGGDEACKLDRSGIPRCFGGPAADAGVACPSGYTGQAPCCISTGNVCQFRDQCCNGQLCLPGSDGGVLRCQGLSCLGAGAACTTDGGTPACCAGNACIQGACRPPPPPPVDAGVLPDGGSIVPDGGAPDAGPVDAGVLCTANGGTCQFSVQCCSMTCTNGTCGPGIVCQPVGGACRAAADCCSGTTCQIPAGQQTGVCSASTCVQQGQTCTAGGLSCCSGLGCYDSNFLPCSGTGSCSCRFGIQ